MNFTLKESYQKNLMTFARNYGVNAQNINSGFLMGEEQLKKHAKACFSFWEDAKQINIILVNDRDGESMLYDLWNPVSGRTDTSEADRPTRPLLSNQTKYKTIKFNTDIFISYARLEQWAADIKLFNARYSEYTQKRVGLDRLIIGWNGISSEHVTQTTASNLSDVAKGWLQIMREQAPNNLIETEFFIDATGATENSHKNLDSAVADLAMQIPENLRDNLVCIIGDNLINNEKIRVYDDIDFYKEKSNADDTFSYFGGIRRAILPGFPVNAIVVTAMANLSIYLKRGSSWRQLDDEPKRERTSDFQTHEIAYVVENTQGFLGLTNVVIV